MRWGRVKDRVEGQGGSGRKFVLDNGKQLGRSLSVNWPFWHMRAVDLVSRSRVSGRVPRMTRCLTAHGSQLRVAFRTNQQPASHDSGAETRLASKRLTGFHPMIQA